MEIIKSSNFSNSPVESGSQNLFDQRQRKIIKDLRKIITYEEYEELLELQDLEKKNPLAALRRQARDWESVIEETSNDFIKGQAEFFLQNIKDEIIVIEKTKDEMATVRMLEEAKYFWLKKQALVLGPDWFKKIWWGLKRKRICLVHKVIRLIRI